MLMVKLKRNKNVINLKRSNNDDWFIFMKNILYIIRNFICIFDLLINTI